jgi:hypothetical protein
MERKPRILYLMENFVDVGIARSIKEKIKCEVYALIDTNKFMQKFFDENIVKFEKKWYYREQIKKINKKIDLEYLKNIETKYGINLWKLAYSERIFYEYNKYYKFSRNEILSIFENECKQFENIIEECNPDFAIIKIPDYNQSQLLFELCKAKKIKILMLNQSRFGYRYFISQKPDNIDNYEQKINKIQDVKNKSLKELQKYMLEYTKMTSSIPKNYGTSSKFKFRAAIRYLIFVCNNEYRKYYVNFGRTRFNIIKNETTAIIKKYFRQRFLNKKSHYKVDNNEKFIFMPLHFQPERSTLQAVPNFVNQLYVIEQIAKSLPIDYKLYVKEHPIQTRTGWRERKYYKKILSMPNVKLIHPSVCNENILNKCSIVITLSGTLGLDAAFYGKPSIVFTDVLYSKLSSVHVVKNTKELPNIIIESLKKEVDIEELNKYTNMILENSFEYDEIDLVIQIQKRFFYGGTLYDVEISKEEFELFIADNINVFKKLGNEYAEKIMEYSKDII